MIRKATYTDIDAILGISRACTDYMIAQNILQWNDRYPNKKSFERDIEREECYVFEHSGDVVGCITISTYMDNIYKTVAWLTPDKDNIYIHRLAVRPCEQGKGYAQQLIGFAELYAKTHNFTSIRLDTFSKNPRNQKFYELRGYQKLEEIYFPNQSEHPFYCYELLL